METYCDLIIQIARELVRRPECVSARMNHEGLKPMIQLEVDFADLGAVIGKQGRTANSIRTILAAASTRDDLKIGLEIIVSQPSVELLTTNQRPMPTSYRSHWGMARIGEQRGLDQQLRRAKHPLENSAPAGLSTITQVRPPSKK